MPFSTALEYKQLYKQLGSSQETLPPLIFLNGSESYYINRLAERVTEHYLSAEECEMGRTQLFGNDLSSDIEAQQALLSNLKTFSLLGGRRLFVVHEAQLIKKLEPYIENAPYFAPETTLVLCYMDDAERNSKALHKAIQKISKEHPQSIITYTAPPIRNARDAATVIHDAARLLDITVQEDALSILYDYIGGRGETLYSELRKLSILAQSKQRTVTRDMVERNVGISREYSPYELLSALIQKNRVQAFRIARQMALNEKNAPLPVTIAVLYNFFANLMVLHYVPTADTPEKMAKVLDLRNSYAAKDYRNAKWSYNAKQTYMIVHEIRMADARSKGAEGNAYTAEGILNDLVTFILG